MGHSTKTRHSIANPYSSSTLTRSSCANQGFSSSSATKLCIKLESERIGRVCLVVNGRNTALSGRVKWAGFKNSSVNSRRAADSTVSPLSTFPPGSFHSPAYLGRHKDAQKKLFEICYGIMHSKSICMAPHRHNFFRGGFHPIYHFCLSCKR